MRRLSSLLLLAGALALVSCGGSDEDKSDAPSPTTSTARTEVARERYIAKADAFCRKANAESKKFNQRAKRVGKSGRGNEEILAALEPIGRKAYAVQRRQRREFEAIPAPPADQKIIAKVRAADDELLALLGRLIDAADSRDAERFAALIADEQRVKQRARGLAQGYGFTECRSGKSDAE